MNIYEVLKILATESKMKIIAYHMKCDHDDKEEQNVGELCNDLDFKQSNASKHLQSLKEAGILESTKEERKVFYKLKPEFVEEYGEIIKFIISKDKELSKRFAKCDC